VVVAAVAVGSTGCLKSENEGKLEGTKWASAYIPEFKGVKGATATLSFSEGGRFTMELRVPQGAIRMSGTWRLGPGSAVYMENVSPALDGQTSFVEYITVSGDVMTMEESNLKIVFTRIDEEMEKAAKASTTPTGPKKNTLSGGGVETTERNGKSVKKTYD
jgi:hypothetical protein